MRADSFLGGIMIFEEERDYILVAKSQTKAVLGPIGHKGDILVNLIIVPETTAAGTVTLYDSTGGTAMDVFVAGTLSDLKPIVLRFRARSTAGAWLLTTGDHVHVIATGRFT